MPIAATLAVALIAASATFPHSMLPPIAVRVVAASDIPASIVVEAIREVDAIWGAAGVRFEWYRGEPAPASALQVIIGGGHSQMSPSFTLPLAWIDVDAETMPAPRIYVSFANVYDLLKDARIFPGNTEMMPLAYRDALLSRAMGRALAHEIGHYLFASKVHTSTGLMKAVHAAVELFSPSRGRFVISPAEQARMAVRRTAVDMALFP